MAIASKPKPKTTHHKKRTAAHHRQSKQYHKAYWPYIPMFLVVVSGLLLSSFMSHPRAVLGWQQNLNQEAMLLATNNDRRANKRPALSLNNQLIQAAQAKAQDMVQKDYWAHDSPTGVQPWQFIVNAGYQYQQAGENLAYGFTSASSVSNAWMHSQEHRDNLLNTSYSQVGFGVAESPNYRGKGAQTVVVAMYALPSDNRTPADINQVNGDGWMRYFQSDNAQPVSRIEAIKPQLSGIIVGVVGTLAVLAVLLRHAIAWRKLIKRGEQFIITHPYLDTALVAVAVAAVLLNQTVGFIR